MVKCPKCKNGKIILSVTEFGKKKTEEVDINCIYCEGKGEITEDYLKEIQEGDKIWCECDEPTFGGYPQDGQCSCGVYKHHVHCGICGKITQIG